MAQTFQEFAADDLAGFGWTIAADEIPEYDTCKAVTRGMSGWWNGLDDATRSIVEVCDVTPGLWQQGYMTDWPALYTLMTGNPFGRFGATMNDILDCLDHARTMAEEQGGGLAGDSGINEVLDEANENQ
jgi:hypothetical protein